MKKINYILIIFCVSLSNILICCAQSSDSEIIISPNNQVDIWLTKSDESVKLQKQNVNLAFNTNNNAYQSIEINFSQTYQSIDGFGYTLTGGSVEVINQLTPTKKQQLLQELFGNSENSIANKFRRLVKVIKNENNPRKIFAFVDSES